MVEYISIACSWLIRMFMIIFSCKFSITFWLWDFSHNQFITHSPCIKETILYKSDLESVVEEKLNIFCLSTYFISLDTRQKLSAFKGFFYYYLIFSYSRLRLSNFCWRIYISLLTTFFEGLFLLNYISGIWYIQVWT